MLLEVEGFQVAAAATAVDALRIVTTEGVRPCIILLDLVMPIVDGLAFRRQLLDVPGLEKTPVVALTGYEPMRQQAESEGFLRALLKPTNIDELIALVGDHCPRAGREPHTGAG